MSSIKIQETFTVPAPVDSVWRAFVEPERIVVCIPGASLEGGEDGTYQGTVKVKVGAVSIQYRGQVAFDEVDADRRFMKLSGKGSEKGGAGAVRMTMESTLSEQLDGTQVTVNMQMQLAGKIVRFGRGMIQSVSQELFQQFTNCLGQTLAADAEATGNAGDGKPGAREDGAEGGGGGHDAGQAAPSEATPQAGTPGSGGAQPAGESLALMPLLFRAFGRWVRSLFGGSSRSS